MAKPPSKYLKDIDAVCAALGIKLPAQRNRANKLRAPVIAWTRGEELPVGASSFPAKTKHGWERAAVLRWDEDRRLKMEYGTKKPSNPQPSTLNPQPALPSQSKPAADGELFDVASAQELRKGRFDRLQDMYLRPEAYEKKIAKFEIEELKSERPWLFEKEGATKKSGVTIPEYCSQSEFARVVSELYNVPVYPMRVSRAVNEEGMPGKMANQSIKTSLALPWWEQHIVQKETSAQGTLFNQAQAAEQQKKIDEARRVRLELEEFERVRSIKWIETAIVESFLRGYGAWLGRYQDKFVEGKEGMLELCFQLVTEHFGGDEAKMAKLRPALRARMIAANDAMKAAVNQEAAAVLEKIMAERRESIAQA